MTNVIDMQAGEERGSLKRQRDDFIRLKAEWHRLEAQCMLSHPRTAEEEAAWNAEWAAFEEAKEHAMSAYAPNFDSIIDKLDLLSTVIQEDRPCVKWRDGRILLWITQLKLDLRALSENVEPIRL